MYDEPSALTFCFGSLEKYACVQTSLSNVKFQAYLLPSTEVAGLNLMTPLHPYKVQALVKQESGYLPISNAAYPLHPPYQLYELCQAAFLRLLSTLGVLQWFQQLHGGL